MTTEAIRKAVDKAGGQSELARKLGLTPQAIQKWCETGRVPAERLLDVERATGVLREELSPDLFKGLTRRRKAAPPVDDPVSA